MNRRFLDWSKIYGNTTQVWTNGAWSSTEYINYENPYYTYNLTAEDIQYFTNSFSSSTISISDVNDLPSSWFSCDFMEITTPIRGRGAKMG